MSKPKKFAVLLLLLLLLAGGFFGWRYLSGEDLGLTRSGNLCDSRAQFAAQADTAKPEGLSGAFLKGVTFRVESIDRRGMTAKVVTETPDLSGLDSLVKEAAAGTQETDYRKKLAYVEEQISQKISGGSLKKISSEAVLSIQKRDGGGYYLEPSAQWSEAVFGQLEKTLEESGGKAMGGTEK